MKREIIWLVLLALLVLAAGPAVQAGSEELLEKLAAYEGKIEAEAQKEIQAKRKEVVKALEAELKLAMTNQQLEEANGIKQSIDLLEARIDAQTPPPIASFKGKWLFYFTNGIYRHYVFDAEGNGFYSQSGEKGQKHMCTIEIESGVIHVRSTNGGLEKVYPAGNELFVAQHWLPGPGTKVGEGPPKCIASVSRLDP